MEKKVYSLQSFDGSVERFAPTKKIALRRAKEMALEVRSSVSICNIVKHQYIGIAEFPYYLRNLHLDLRDISLNFC